MSRITARCHRWTHHIADNFGVLAGVSGQSSHQHHSPRIWHGVQQSSIRSFRSSGPAFEGSSKVSDSAILQDSTLSAPNSTSTSSSSTPWYLQVQTPEPPAPMSPHLALQEIPPIPEDAPPIVSPILSHLSTQVGLDNLALLDLRDVYPPPALGANLIMILGTARSYKHLNTSADRFCRWLRSNYKLHPYADGLLGRNEMKLKLRRKARRMRLAQSVGNTVAMGATEGGDDGITTGWVCVNIGAVDGVQADATDIVEDQNSDQQSMREQEEIEADEDEYKNPPDDSGVIGFGSQDTRPRIVVQMFTEDKRLEMDLEGLWNVRVERRERKEEKLEQEFMRR